MKQDIKLYIADKEVDFSSELSLPFVYQLEDTNNPTVIKNMFTKTINIVGTKNNNKIFGDIYEFDRNQLINDEYLTGAYFNPSKRTPFQLFNNGELIESGYMQLNSITLKDKIINYQITLYGGLGDFFYNISYNEENEPLKLSDLKFKVKDKFGVELESDKEMDFKINADFVKKCWETLSSGFATGEIYDYISFAPSYNGLHEDFDNNKVLVNTHNNNVFTTTSSTIDSTNYKTYNGFALCELNNEYSEWEMRDLRSYHQRPVLKLSKLIEAIADKDNNGGYTVEFDRDFFNKGNPYYNDAYIALPLFTSALKSDEANNIKVECNVGLKPTPKVGNVNGTLTSQSMSYIFPINSDVLTTDGETIDNSETSVQSVFNVELDYQLSLVSDVTNDLYDGYSYSKVVVFNGYVNHITMLVGCATFIQAVVEDESGKILGYSDITEFTNLSDDKFQQFGQQEKYIDFNPVVKEATKQKVLGHWVYSSTNKKHNFVTEKGNNTYRLKINNIQRADTMKIKLYVYRCSNNTGMNIGNVVPSQIYSDNTTPTYNTANISLIADENSTLTINIPNSNIYTNARITKQSLLKTEKTPCDYLLSYCKLFGLYFSKDTTTKTIYIRQRNNYFKNKVNNWNNRIDKSKDIKISPIIFDYKFYRMTLENTGDYLNEKYSNEYGVNYGQKRINTNYNFNGDTKDMLDGNVYQNTIPLLGTSLYYRKFYNDKNVEVPPFVNDGFTYKLFNTSNKIESADVEFPISVNLSKTQPINAKSGYDVLPKQCFFKKDNSKESLNDISSSLLFFNGFPKQSKVDYYLTDDLPIMGLLNNSKPCYISTQSNFDSSNQFVGYKYNDLPQFLSVKTRANNITDTFDMGKPKEIYISNTNYEEDVTIYNRYWRDFYNDELDINTKKVSANVNLNGINVNSELMREFYHFGNSNWILNKIENYEPNKNVTTKCEFIRVQNIKNYTKSIGVTNDYISTDYPAVVDANSGTLELTVYSTVEWKVGATYGSVSVSPRSGTTGETKISIRYSSNTSYDKKIIGCSLIKTDSALKPNCIIQITQMPDNVVTMSGRVRISSVGTLTNGIMRIKKGSNIVSTAQIDKQSGIYEILVPKQSNLTIEVLENDVSVYTENFTTAPTNNFTKNIMITQVNEAPEPTNID